MIPIEFTFEELRALHEEDHWSPHYVTAMAKIEQARAVEEGSCGDYEQVGAR